MSASKDLTRFLKQERVWMFLAYVSNGAHQRDAIAKFPFVLVVVFLQHGFPHLLPQILLQLTRGHHAVDHHVWVAQKAGPRKTRQKQQENNWNVWPATLWGTPFQACAEVCTEQNIGGKKKKKL